MRETADLEFKREPTKTYLKTVSAFANYGTGKILFGINDDGSPAGLENPRTSCLDIENAINDSLSPVPRFELSIDDEHRTVALTVFEGAEKPFLYKGKAYRRNNSATVEVDRLEFNRLILKGSNRTFDALESEQQNLSFNMLSRELSSKVGITQLDNNALVSLELRKPDGMFDNAAALLADENAFFGTDIARFGESTSIILSRHTFERQSLLKQLDETMSVFEEHYTYEEVVGYERVKRERIPREAFREAIANALVHRCWDVRASITVRMFANRIEIISPGGLPDGITEEAYLAGGPSVVRNPILANVFFRLGHIERFGTGIPRIIDAYSNATVSPHFEIKKSYVSVTLPTIDAISITADERLILAEIPKGESKNRTDLERATGLSKDKILRIINGLVEKELVIKTGAGRSVRYSRR